MRCSAFFRSRSLVCLHDVSPSKLLPPGLKPAATLEKLSPADRVFGWVRQNEGPDEPVGETKALDRGPALQGSAPDLPG